MADVERRKPENAVARLLYGKVQTVEHIVTEVRAEVKITNGNVGRNKKKIGEHEGKLKAIEDNEIFQDGFRKGKFSMKTSTRNAILVFIAAVGLYFAGVREIRHHKSVEITSLKKQLYSKSHQLEAIEQWFRSHKEPVTESDIANRLNNLLKNSD